MGMLQEQNENLAQEQSESLGQEQTEQANKTEQPVTAPAPSSDGRSFEQLRAAAIEFIYNERFEQMLDVFKTKGAEGFANAMATIINGALTNIGPMSHEDAAAVGMELYLMLLQDIITSDVVPGVTMEQVNDVLPTTIRQYANANNDVTEQDVQALMQQIQQKKDAGGMQNGNA